MATERGSSAPAAGLAVPLPQHIAARQQGVVGAPAPLQGPLPVWPMLGAQGPAVPAIAAGTGARGRAKRKSPSSDDGAASNSGSTASASNSGDPLAAAAAQTFAATATLLGGGLPAGFPASSDPYAAAGYMPGYVPPVGGNGLARPPKIPRTT